MFQPRLKIILTNPSHKIDFSVIVCRSEGSLDLIRPKERGKGGRWVEVGGRGGKGRGLRLISSRSSGKLYADVIDLCRLSCVIITLADLTGGEFMRNLFFAWENERDGDR